MSVAVASSLSIHCALARLADTQKKRLAPELLIPTFQRRKGLLPKLPIDLEKLDLLQQEKRDSFAAFPLKMPH